MLNRAYVLISNIKDITLLLTFLKVLLLLLSVNENTLYILIPYLLDNMSWS